MSTLFSGIPSIQIMKNSYDDSNVKTLYCELGKISVFQFHISGYPLPKVEWDFQNYAAENFNYNELYNQKPVNVLNNIDFITKL